MRTPFPSVSGEPVVRAIAPNAIWRSAAGSASAFSLRRIVFSQRSSKPNTSRKLRTPGARPFLTCGLPEHLLSGCGQLPVRVRRCYPGAWRQCEALPGGRRVLTRSNPARTKRYFTRPKQPFPLPSGCRNTALFNGTQLNGTESAGTGF